MSGIYGMVRFDGAPVTREMLAPMGAAMSFWGPDGHGQWCGESAGLGHLKLHVTPESLYEQLPASISTAPHLVITADARIDNRDELFGALGVPAPSRDRTPDSDLILMAYQRWGVDCVRRLLGDFAFAIRDSRKRTLFCARDVSGCRPFVYHSDGKRFVFASDIKGVLARIESPKLNEPMLAAYLQFRTYHAGKRYTFFEEVVKLPPAHTLLVSDSGLHLSRYWSPEDAPAIRLTNDDEYAEQMRALFEDAVRCRLRSVFPVGSHLSGGLDSSAISVMAARSLRERGKSLAAFSWSPAPGANEEFGPSQEHSRIREVCRAEDLECQYLPVTTQNYFDLFRTDITTEPIEMMAREGNVQAAASIQGLRVILSGWGGDEAVSNRGARAPVATLPGLLSPRLPDFFYAAMHSRARIEHTHSCIQDTFARSHKEAVRGLRNAVFRPQRGVRDTMIHRLEYGHLVRRMEDWAASGARNGLVYRFPLLDKRIVEFALAIPGAQFRRVGGNVPVFRRAATNLLPPTVDWNLRKAEARGIAELKQAYHSACRHWVGRVYRKMGDSRADNWVDREKLRRAVQPNRPHQIADLLGTREAFACYAIRCGEIGASS